MWSPNIYEVAAIVGLGAFGLLGVQVTGFVGTLLRGSYPRSFAGYLVLWLGPVIKRSRYPNMAVGYDPLGRVLMSMVLWGVVT